MADQRTAQERILWLFGIVIVIFYALFPVLWIISLSLKTPATVTVKEGEGFWGTVIPKEWTFDNYKGLFTGGFDSPLLRPLINSIGIAPDRDAHRVVLAMLAAYAIARLNFPGKTLILARRLAIAMFPPISVVGPLFDMWRSLGLYDTWPG